MKSKKEYQKKLSELKKTIVDNNDSENEELKHLLLSYFAMGCDEIRYLYKNPQYQIEKEYRYLVFHKLENNLIKGDERDIPYLYVETEPNIFRKGTEIIIGPKAENPIAQKLDIEFRLRKYGFNDVKVHISKAKYK